MSFIVYIIYSKVLNQFYIGHTGNLKDRLFRHNSSGSKATKKAKDWAIVYQEHFNTRSEAFKREMEIKKKKSRKYLEQLANTDTSR